MATYHAKSCLIAVSCGFIIMVSAVPGQEDQKPLPSRNDNAELFCICNPDDNNTGAVCANDGKTYTSACDFRLKQGLHSDVGIRCVGNCPCDDSLISVGVDCGTTAINQLTTPSSGLEFCGTNAVTYNNENMFMCDQLQDASLAISCPGSCPCHLADCPNVPARRSEVRSLEETTTATHTNAALPAAILPSAGFTRSTTLGTSSITKFTSKSEPGNTNRASESIPAIIPAVTVSTAMFSQPVLPWSPPPWSHGPAVKSVKSNGAQPLPNQPMVVPIPNIGLTKQPNYNSNSGYGALPGGGDLRSMTAGADPLMPAASPTGPHNAETRALHGVVMRGPPSHGSPTNSVLPRAAYNPLAEALRSVPFRLFRHLYILITVASEGMKQIPGQIAKNMQARLPPYVRDIPMQVAEATQEALAIHFDSLARQVKDAVDAVRSILDSENSQ